MSAQVMDYAEPAARAWATPAPMLSLQGVAHSFGGLQVLRDVNLAVPAGRITGLIGPNGSGKTTCFNIVSGFLRPRAGQVVFDGRDITADSVQQRSHAGLVRTFQTPQVFEQMTVLENLMVGRYKATHTGVLQAMLRTPAARAEHEAMRASAEAACARFGLERLRDARAA
ncbi:MAG: ABC transporter ATP-binding protein, partial [Cupriavidus necator]